MAGALKKMMTNRETREWIFSTHFWGPVLNWGIPLAAIADTQKDPKIISGKMTLALTFYSAVFMRFSLVVKPRNLLLFSCHVVNVGAQITQGTRFINYHYLSKPENNSDNQEK